MKNYIFGDGSHSREVRDLILEQYPFLDPFLDIVAVGYEIEQFFKNIRENSPAYLGLGNCKKRKEIMEKFNQLDWPILISKYARLYQNCKVGEGTIIFDGVVIKNSAKIGRGCLLNINSSIGHDVTIGDYSIISTGVIILGNCTIGEGVFVGTGSIIKDGGIIIGDNANIGMGSVVIFNVKDHERVFGNPAKKMVYPNDTKN